jgi:type II secretory pathway pseudopilin PulG
MVLTQKRRIPSGFTLVELLAIAVVVVVLAGLLLPALSGSHKSLRIYCINNLKQVSLAHRMFAGDHGDKFPIQISTNLGGTKEWAGSQEVYRHFQVLSNELGNLKILCCPDDKERVRATNFADFGNANLSYFLEQNAKVISSSNQSSGLSLLIGDRNLAANGTMLPNGCHMVSTQQVLTWDLKTLHTGAGNFCLTDGSARQASDTILQTTRLQQSIRVNWLAIP